MQIRLSNVKSADGGFDAGSCCSAKESGNQSVMNVVEMAENVRICVMAVF
jgi:hypothetical protein